MGYSTLKMKHMLGRGLLCGMVLLAILYGADWAVFEARAAHQTAFSTVRVDQFVGASLKGNKQEYYYAGTVEEPCVKSIFPHVSDSPCWWLKKHSTQWKTVFTGLGTVKETVNPRGGKGECRDWVRVVCGRRDSNPYGLSATSS